MRVPSFGPGHVRLYGGSRTLGEGGEGEVRVPSWRGRPPTERGRLKAARQGHTADEWNGAESSATGPDKKLKETILLGPPYLCQCGVTQSLARSKQTQGNAQEQQNLTHS